MRRALAIVLLAATALSACNLDPHYVRPTPAIPTAWPVGAAYPPPTPATAPTLSYRDVFQDLHLQAIIGQALANNQDLRIALANVEIAHAQFGVQRAQQFPHINATGAAAETHGRATTTGQNGSTSSSGVTSRSFALDVGFSAFDIDLFGRLRSLSRAAQDRYLATEAGVRAARLALVGQVADGYLIMATDRSLLAIAQQTEIAAQKSVDLTRAKLTGGISPRSDLSLALTTLDQARSDRALLTTAVAQDRNALQLLVGATVPDADLPASIESVGGLLAELPAGLSSEILLRRPDVVEAEYGLKAANAQIGAARAAFFPSISLTAIAGLASPALSALFSGASRTWQAGAAGSLPLFDGGANAANLAGAKGQRNLAVAQYQKAVQTAFREVADALARRGTIKDQVAAQTALVAAATDSYNLEYARYREGVDPYLATLITQRTLYLAQQGLASTYLTQAANLVALYQSLGGDQLLDAPPAAPRRQP
ncbi:MAG: efflux transporter outer rane subunit [Phenylobacterium sp.]|nr:efflux transporter outer rane subunit [Phenylobacterium sp.]